MTFDFFAVNAAFALWTFGSGYRGALDSFRIIIRRWRETARQSVVQTSVFRRSIDSFLLFSNSFLLLVAGVFKELKYRLFAPKVFDPLRLVSSSIATASPLPTGSACIVYVPGTWWQAGAASPTLALFLANNFPDRRVMVFTWRSRNSAIGRASAAKTLAEQFSTNNLMAHAKTIYLVGHSHGGSVCSAAAAIVANRRCKVVVLGTPFVEFYKKDALNMGGVAAFFGVLLWPLLLLSFQVGSAVQAVSNEHLPVIVPTMAALLLIALLTRAFIRINVKLEKGPSKNYGRCTNIVADGDILIQTMEKISDFFQNRSALLEALVSANDTGPRRHITRNSLWLTALIYFGGFASFLFLLFINRWLAIVPACVVVIWFYYHPSRLPWRIAHFAPTVLLMANPVAVVLTLSAAVTFGGNVLLVALGRARVTRSPTGSRCVPVSVTDITGRKAINIHSAMLESDLVRTKLLRLLQ